MVSFYYIKKILQNQWHVCLTKKNKFKGIDCEPTITPWFNTLQTCLRKLKNNGEITEAEFTAIKSKNVRPAEASSLAKIHRDFDNLPPCRPITDTNGTGHYLTAKCLAKLIIKPLTTNGLGLDDSYYAARKLNNILKELLNCGYKYVSFDVESFFTNVPLRKNVNIILKRVYSDKLIQTNLKKQSLKKLLLDSCT